MKKDARVLLLSIAAILLLLVPSIASATSVNLIWTGTNGTPGAINSVNGNSVTINPSGVATLTLDIQLVVDSRGVSSAFLTFDFDTDLDNEINLLSYSELSWSNGTGTRNLSPITPGIGIPCQDQYYQPPGFPPPDPIFLGCFGPTSSESTTNGVAGLIFEFEGTTIGNGPKNTTLTFARLVFTTNHGLVNSNQINDIFSRGLIGGNAGGSIISDAVFGTASVNAIPEPGTVLLLGLGVGTLALAGRRQGRK